MHTQDQFVYDFLLVVNNCRTYNSKDTSYVPLTASHGGGTTLHSICLFRRYFRCADVTEVLFHKLIKDMEI
jgi:hypothetical protein